MRYPIFLDRDGVINEEPSKFGKDYVTSCEEFQFIPGAIDALKMLVENDWDIYIISNQAGVAKGIFTVQQLQDVTGYMLKILNQKGIKINGIFYCIHRSEDNCNCRKPKTGNLQLVWEKYPGLKKDKIFFVGDQERDIQAARNFSISSILVLSGKTGFSELGEFSIIPDYVAYNLYDAVRNIILK